VVRLCVVLSATADLPPWQTVYWYFARWEQASVRENQVTALRVKARVAPVGHSGLRGVHQSPAHLGAAAVTTSVRRSDQQSRHRITIPSGRQVTTSSSKSPRSLLEVSCLDQFSATVAAVLGGLVSSRWVWVLWDLVIATVVATVAVQYRSASVQDVVIGLGMAGAIVFRRMAPVPVFAVVSSLALLQLFVCRAVPAGYDLALLVAMAAVVTHARRSIAPYAAGTVVLAGVVVLAVKDIVIETTGPAADFTSLGEYFTLIVAFAALWLLTFVLRVHRERNVVLGELLGTAQRERDHLARLAAADERAFIARELHDIVAHSLAVMVAQADGASYAIGTDAAQAGEAMRTVAATGRDALDDMHRIVGVLRGTGSATDSSDERRRRGIDQLATLVAGARTAGLQVDLRIGEIAGLGLAGELTVFRLVQEALTNCLRHAGPGTSVEVALRLSDRETVLEISDDGSGTPDGKAGGGGNGLIGMRERVTVHDGEFAAGPGPGGGWLVRATIPVEGAV
jgi:signal transduction histidine kinase